MSVAGAISGAWERWHQPVRVAILLFVAFWITHKFDDVDQAAQKAAREEVQSTLPTPWATISEFHATWVSSSNQIQLSLVLDKRASCHRTLVNKILRPVEKGVVVTDEVITLVGTLPSQIHDAPIGRSTTFDLATPARVPSPGHYFLVIVAYCENPEGRTAADLTASTSVLGTEPQQTLVVIDQPRQAAANHTPRYDEP